MRGEFTISLIFFILGTVVDWINLTFCIMTPTPYTVVSSPVEFDDQIDVGVRVQCRQEDVEN